MTDQKTIERAETKRYVQALLQRGESTRYIKEMTGLSGSTISRYRIELGMEIEEKEVDLKKKMEGSTPVCFEEDWNKYAGIIRRAYQNGRTRKVIKIVPEEKGRK